MTNKPKTPTTTMPPSAARPEKGVGLCGIEGVRRAQIHSHKQNFIWPVDLPTFKNLFNIEILLQKFPTN